MSAARAAMSRGALYDPGHPDLAAARATAQALMRRYNETIVSDSAARREILSALLGATGEGGAIRAPFYVDYGFNIRLGDGVFMNYGCVLLDICPIEIGHRTAIGPHAQLLTADHPRKAADRAKGLETGRPIRIGADVWIGGGAIILPGVSVGDGAVIGAGSVVTKDVAEGVTVAGNPAGVIGREPETDQLGPA